jgi:hypothetical protein
MKAKTPATSPRYVTASLPAWREAAAQAITKGKTESDFLAACHPDNRNMARTAYHMERAALRVPARRGITMGTAHFVTRRAAVRYYTPYENGDIVAALDAVARKLAEGQIHIGPPALKAGQTLSLNREEGRYFITE